MSLYVNNVYTVSNWLSNTVLRLSQAPAVGVPVLIRRKTPNDRCLVDYSDGTVLTEYELDLSNRQLLFLIQEAFDSCVMDGVGSGGGGGGVIDAAGRRIINIGNPTDPYDAVSLVYVKWLLQEYVKDYDVALKEQIRLYIKNHDEYIKWLIQEYVKGYDLALKGQLRTYIGNNNEYIRWLIQKYVRDHVLRLHSGETYIVPPGETEYDPITPPFDPSTPLLPYTPPTVIPGPTDPNPPLDPYVPPVIIPGEPEGPTVPPTGPGGNNENPDEGGEGGGGGGGGSEGGNENPDNPPDPWDPGGGGSGGDGTTYTITAIAAEGTIIEPEGVTEVASGADQIMTVTAMQGYKLTRFVIDGTHIIPPSETEATYTFQSVTDNHTFETRAEQVHTVTIIAGEHGKVRAFTAIGNGKRSVITVLAGQTGTLLVPNEGYVECEMTGDEGYRVYMVSLNGSTPEQFPFHFSLNTVTRDHTIEITFGAGNGIASGSAQGGYLCKREMYDDSAVFTKMKKEKYVDAVFTYGYIYALTETDEVMRIARPEIVADGVYGHKTRRLVLDKWYNMPEGQVQSLEEGQDDQAQSLFQCKPVKEGGVLRILYRLNPNPQTYGNDYSLSDYSAEVQERAAAQYNSTTAMRRVSLIYLWGYPPLGTQYFTDGMGTFMVYQRDNVVYMKEVKTYDGKRIPFDYNRNTELIVDDRAAPVDGTDWYCTRVALNAGTSQNKVRVIDIADDVDASRLEHDIEIDSAQESYMHAFPGGWRVEITGEGTCVFYTVFISDAYGGYKLHCIKLRPTGAEIHKTIEHTTPRTKITVNESAPLRLKVRENAIFYPDFKEIYEMPRYTMQELQGSQGITPKTHTLISSHAIRMGVEHSQPRMSNDYYHYALILPEGAVGDDAQMADDEIIDGVPAPVQQTPGDINGGGTPGTGGGGTPGTGGGGGANMDPSEMRTCVVCGCVYNLHQGGTNTLCSACLSARE